MGRVGSRTAPDHYSESAPFANGRAGRDQLPTRRDHDPGRLASPAVYLKLSFALRIAPSASAFEASSAMPKVFRISRESARRNGL